MSRAVPAELILRWLVRTFWLRLLNAAVAAAASSPCQESAIDRLAVSICSATLPSPSAAAFQVSAACMITTGCALVARSSFCS